MVLAGIILSALANTTCNFISYVHDDVTGKAGFWRYAEEGDECIYYDRVLDKSEKFAKDASILAPVTASLALLIILVKLCYASCKGSRLMVSCLLLTSVLAQGTTFAFFNSDEFW